MKINSTPLAEAYLARLSGVLDQLDLLQFQRIVDLLLEAYTRQRHVFTMGNGGSGATASHLVCDLNKGCCSDLASRFKVMCLNDNMPSMLAIANDISFEAVFEAQLQNFFTAGDVVMAFSGSGNSPNVIRAIQYARAHGGQTIGLTGYAGGQLAPLVDVALIVPSDDMQQIEDVHMIVVHMLMQICYKALHATSQICSC